jgi:dolichol-phosphate mannosyltransferase
MSPATSRPSVSFIVPALNEEGNIEATVTTILAAANGHVSDFEIVLVNDGSTDRTGDVMERLARNNDKIRVVHNKQNLGFGGAYKEGAAAAQCDYIIRVCADNALPTATIGSILERIGDADIVIPYISNPEFRSVTRRVGSRGFTIIINTLFGLRVRYYNHSVVFPRDVLRTISISTDGFAYQAEALVKLLKAGYTYTEVGVQDVGRVVGRSSALKPNTLLNVFRAIWGLTKDMRQPGAIPKQRLPRPAAQGKIQS